MIYRTSLPDEIVLTTGERLKPVIGGCIDNTPFLTVEHSGVDVRQNGWANGVKSENQLAIGEAKRRKLKYRKVGVISRNLRRSRDLHNRPYSPTVWVFVQVPSA